MSSRIHPSMPISPPNFSRHLEEKDIYTLVEKACRDKSLQSLENMQLSFANEDAELTFFYLEKALHHPHIFESFCKEALRGPIQRDFLRDQIFPLFSKEFQLTTKRLRSKDELYIHRLGCFFEPYLTKDAMQELVQFYEEHPYLENRGKEILDYSLQQWSSMEDQLFQNLSTDLQKRTESPPSHWFQHIQHTLKPNLNVESLDQLASLKGDLKQFSQALSSMLQTQKKFSFIQSLRATEIALIKSGFSKAKVGEFLRDWVLEKALSEENLAGITYVQQHWTHMHNHLASFQSILEQKGLESPMLLDQNGNHKLDASDILVHQENGILQISSLGQELSDDLRIKEAILSSIKELVDDKGKPKHKFAILENLQCNEEIFELCETNSSGVYATMKLRKGVRASDGMDDIVVNFSLYQFDCHILINIVFLRACQKVLGEDVFNQHLEDMIIGPGDYSSFLREHINYVQGEEALILDIGEHGYINNPDVSKKGIERGYQGENFLQGMGEQIFAHPFGLASLSKVKRALARHTRKKNI